MLMTPISGNATDRMLACSRTILVHLGGKADSPKPGAVNGSQESHVVQHCMNSIVSESKWKIKCFSVSPTYQANVAERRFLVKLVFFRQGVFYMGWD